MGFLCTCRELNQGKLGVLYIQAHFDLSGLISMTRKQRTQSMKIVDPQLGIEPESPTFRAGVLTPTPPTILVGLDGLWGEEGVRAPGRGRVGGRESSPFRHKRVCLYSKILAVFPIP